MFQIFTALLNAISSFFLSSKSNDNFPSYLDKNADILFKLKGQDFTQALREYLQQGHNPNALGAVDGSPNSLAFKAVWEDNIAALELLIEHKAQLSSHLNDSLLPYCHSLERLPTLIYLLQNEASPYIDRNRDDTPWAQALQSNIPQVVQAYLEHGKLNLVLMGGVEEIFKALPLQPHPEIIRLLKSYELIAEKPLKETRQL